MLDRRGLFERIKARQQWDIVVIGGGAAGLGTAVDAATRGYATLLLEASDFASGPSGSSAGVMYGAVHRLAPGHLDLLRETRREHTLLRRNAPHLVHELPVVVPGFTWWSNTFYGARMLLYGLLAGGGGLGFFPLVSRQEALRLVPTLEPQGLRGGVVYHDGLFDDARLAITLLLTLLDAGGVALNYAPVTGLIKEGTRIVGVYARDAETGAPLVIGARVVVNATGIAADGVRQMDDPGAPAAFAVGQSVHVVLDRSFLPGNHALCIPKTDDGHMLFAIPWNERVIVGTAATPVNGAAPSACPLPEAVEAVLRHAARYLSRDPHPQDVLSSHASRYPLVGAAARKDAPARTPGYTLEVAPSGLVTLIGGMWAMYRKMAEDAVNKAAEVGGLPRRLCVTRTLKLHGWRYQHTKAPFAVYGSDAASVKTVLAERPGWDLRLHSSLPYRAGEVVWAARHELARTVEDVLARRTRALLLDARASVQIAPQVAELLAEELGFDADWQARQVQQFRGLAQQYQHLPEGMVHVPVHERSTA